MKHRWDPVYAVKAQPQKPDSHHLRFSTSINAEQFQGSKDEVKLP